MAPAFESDAAKRSLLVLQFFLAALRPQLYVAGSPSVSIKKPLNAFLGELFTASWTSALPHDEKVTATTRLVAEQVSHHPPITAVHIRDAVHGVRADGYARVEMTFAGAVDIRQIGHGVMHVDRFDEDYLFPLPHVKVRGFLGGRLYPEILGTYHIVSSSGFVSEMTFSGAGFCWGRKNGFAARVYRRDDAQRQSIFEVEGTWSGGWTVKDGRTGEVMEKYAVDAPENVPAPIEMAPLQEQDPWESRRAWAGVAGALARNDFGDTVAQKTRLEQAQRQRRRREKEAGVVWEPRFFRSSAAAGHAVFHQLSRGLSWPLCPEKTKGVWRVDEARLGSMRRPFRDESAPTE